MSHQQGRVGADQALPSSDGSPGSVDSSHRTIATPEATCAPAGWNPAASTHSIGYLITRHRQHTDQLRSNSRKEVERYGYPTLRRFGTDLADINRANLRRVYQELQAEKANQIDRRIALVKRVLDWAADPLKGFLNEHPLPSLKVPKNSGEHKDQRVFTLTEAQAILRVAHGTRWHTPFLIYFETGVRKQALMLCVGADWDAPSRRLTVREQEGNKVKREITLPVGRTAAQAIVSRDPLGPLFPSPHRGGFYAEKTPYEALKRFCEKADVAPGGPHAMRRFCATEIARLTGKCSTASLALGHRDVRTSLAQNRYIRVGPEDARAAVEKLERKLLMR